MVWCAILKKFLGRFHSEMEVQTVFKLRHLFSHKMYGTDADLYIRCGKNEKSHLRYRLWLWFMIHDVCWMNIVMGCEVQLSEVFRLWCAAKIVPDRHVFHKFAKTQWHMPGLFCLAHIFSVGGPALGATALSAPCCSEPPMLVGPQGRHHAALPGPEADPRRSTQLGIGRSMTVSLQMTSLNYFPLSHSGALVGLWYNFLWSCKWEELQKHPSWSRPTSG